MFALLPKLESGGLEDVFRTQLQISTRRPAKHTKCQGLASFLKIAIVKAAPISLSESCTSSFIYYAYQLTECFHYPEVAKFLKVLRHCLGS